MGRWNRSEHGVPTYLAVSSRLSVLSMIVGLTFVDVTFYSFPQHETLSFSLTGDSAVDGDFNRRLNEECSLMGTDR